MIKQWAATVLEMTGLLAFVAGLAAYDYRWALLVGGAGVLVLGVVADYLRSDRPK